jgi:hypothetical protein
MATTGTTKFGEHTYSWYGNYTPNSALTPYGPNDHPLPPGKYLFEHRLNYEDFSYIHYIDMDKEVSIVDIDMDIGNGCLAEENEDIGPGAFIFNSIDPLTTLFLYQMNDVSCHPDAMLTLRVIEGGDKIKIWADSSRNTLEWDPANPGVNGLVLSRVNSSMTGGEVLFLEAVGTSSTMLAGDITLRWAWEADRIYSDIVKLTAVELPPLSCPAVLGASNFRAPGYDPFPDLGGGEVGGCDETSLASQVFIENCDVSWMPKGGSVDNTVEITAYEISNCITGQFIFELIYVSDEKGYCLNAPNPCPASGEDAADWKDLQFPEQDGFTLTGNNIATSDATDLKEATVTVKCYDYGAFGKIKVKFKKDGTGTEYIGKEVVDNVVHYSKEYTSIPFDQNTNYIRDGSPQNTGPDNSYSPMDDNDNNPIGANVAGDQLTRYEEYRGFMYKDPANPSSPSIHVRTSTTEKDVFIFDKFNQGYGFFDKLEYTIHRFIGTATPNELEENVAPLTYPVGGGLYVTENDFKKYILDFNRDSFSQNRINYAIYLTILDDQELSYGATILRNDSGARCQIPKLYLETLDPIPYPGVVDRIIAHELGHAVYIFPPNGPPGHGHTDYKFCIMDDGYDPYSSSPDDYCDYDGTDNYKCIEKHKLRNY